MGRLRPTPPIKRVSRRALSYTQIVHKKTFAWWFGWYTLSIKLLLDGVLDRVALQTAFDGNRERGRCPHLATGEHPALFPSKAIFSYRDMKKENPSYYAIIPADVRYAKINANAKLLYGEISALCNKEGFCWASNAYFAKLYGKKQETISSWVSVLQKEGFIEIETDGKNRVIRMLPKNRKDASEKSEGYASEKSEDNNTSSNTTKNRKGAKAPFTALGAEIIDAFTKVDPKNKRFYGHKVQREACDFLIAEYGFEKVLGTVASLPMTNKLPYFPKIYTPKQLENDWHRLHDAAASSKLAVITKKPKVI